MKKRYTLWLAAGILVLAAGLWLFMRLTRKPGAEVVVTVDGTETARYALSEPRSELIDTGRGTNLLVIQDEKAKVTEADCPDRLCVNQKAISYQGESIICLPHKLTVTIEGGEHGSVDAVAQ